jgi:hypothetical protein
MPKKPTKPAAKPKTKSAAKPVSSSKPDWLMSTPATLYSLEACHTGGIGNQQLIELTQEEFNSLKESLYEFRNRQEAAHA